MNKFNYKELFLLLLFQEIAKKYKNSFLGLYWIIITPLFMLTIYTFVFGYVFSIKWPGYAETNLFQFSLILYCGLAFYNTFSEVVSRSPLIVLENANYVKKVVFPLEILTVVSVVASIINLLINLTLIALVKISLFSHIGLEIFYIFIIIIFFMIMMLGITWIFAAIGVFIRDLHHVTSSSVQGLLFLSPIFYPISSLPSWLQPFILLNPICVPVEQARKVLIYSQTPDVNVLMVYGGCSILILLIGYYFFKKTRKGFADVI
tara:strand:- start:1368 stop:2153 length:786 start_codon:yes stop_codon:yes gene_type:complete